MCGIAGIARFRPQNQRGILEAMVARDTAALRRIIPAHLASGQSAAERRLADGSDLLV